MTNPRLLERWDQLVMTNPHLMPTCRNLVVTKDNYHLLEVDL